MHFTHRLEQLALSLLVTSAAGCAQQPDRGLSGDEPQTVSFLVSRVALSPYEQDGTPGFDLDGIDSQGVGSGVTCEDARFDDAWGDELGVDALANMLADLYADKVGATPDEEFARAIAEERLLLVVQVRGVTARDDGPVEVALLAASRADDPATPRDERADALVDEEGRVRAGALVEVHELAVASGTIEGHRVHARWRSLSIPVRPPVALFPTEDLAATELAFDLVGRGGGPTLSGGVLGTSFALDAIEADAHARGLPDADDVVLFLSQIADLEPSPEDRNRCERISAAFSFEAVDVRIAE